MPQIWIRGLVGLVLAAGFASCTPDYTEDGNYSKESPVVGTLVPVMLPAAVIGEVFFEKKRTKITFTLNDSGSCMSPLPLSQLQINLEARKKGKLLSSHVISPSQRKFNQILDVVRRHPYNARIYYVAKDRWISEKSVTFDTDKAHLRLTIPCRHQI